MIGYSFSCGDLRMRTDPNVAPCLPHVMKEERAARWQQYQQAEGRQGETGISLEIDPLVPVELRDHACAWRFASTSR